MLGDLGGDDLLAGAGELDFEDVAVVEAIGDGHVVVGCWSWVGRQALDDVPGGARNWEVDDLVELDFVGQVHVCRHSSCVHVYEL